jgi:hypothetical protein
MPIVSAELTVHAFPVEVPIPSEAEELLLVEVDRPPPLVSMCDAEVLSVEAVEPLIELVLTVLLVTLAFVVLLWLLVLLEFELRRSVPLAAQPFVVVSLVPCVPPWLLP